VAAAASAKRVPYLMFKLKGEKLIYSKVPSPWHLPGRGYFAHAERVFFFLTYDYVVQRRKVVRANTTVLNLISKCSNSVAVTLLL